MTRSKPVILIILDGWGESSTKEGNAILNAATPTWDHLMKTAPHMLLSGSGEDVGLPEGQMGNSEVGHLTIGSGRVIDQDLTRITKSIQQGDFFQNKALLEAFDHAHHTPGTSVHILGLLSEGGVHSHQDHIFACLKMAQDNGVKHIYLHVFLDGRDTPPKSAQASLEALEKIIATMPHVHVASICGRYYAMDRDKRWDRVKLAYDAIASGQAPFTASSSLEALEKAYQRGETDEFVKPTCILIDGKTVSLHADDSLIYMNFRSDRARALTSAFTSPTFTGFDRTIPLLKHVVTLTEYDPTLPVKVAFSIQTHKNVLSDYLHQHHLTQLHVAETEKYAHVTFFFNGGKEASVEGETRILIPSPKVATYDECPQMSAFEITEVVIKAILEQHYDFIVCNFANADMVGHTGHYDATVKAIQTLDSCLGKIIDALHTVQGEALITSDHGNAECMENTHTHQAHTAHTTSLVPLVYVGLRPIQFHSKEGRLSDVAPTLLTLMGLPVPPEMTGTSLC